MIPLWLERAARGEALQVYGGEQILDFVPVGMAVDALLAASGCSLDGPVNVATGVGIGVGPPAGGSRCSRPPVGSRLVRWGPFEQGFARSNFVSGPLLTEIVQRPASPALSTRG